MKTLIVYFSLDGNTKWIAEKIHRKLPNTDLHTIELTTQPLKNKWWRMISYGFKTTFYRKMAIKDSTLDLSLYDNIIVGAPVWAGNVPPPVKEFLNEYSLTGKKVAAFCSMGGEPSHFFDKLKELAKVDAIEPTLAIVEPLQYLTEETFEKVNVFAKEIMIAFELEEVNDLVTSKK